MIRLCGRRARPSPELAALGVARVSRAIFLYLDAMARLQEHLGVLET